MALGMNRGQEEKSGDGKPFSTLREPGACFCSACFRRQQRSLMTLPPFYAKSTAPQPIPKMYELKQQVYCRPCLNQVSDSSLRRHTKSCRISPPPNTMPQEEDMDLFTGLQLVSSACTCVGNLRSKTEFMALFRCYKDATEEPVLKRQRTPNTSFAMYVITHEDPNNETELRRLYFSCIDAVCGEMKEHFGERNCMLILALKSPDPKDSTFLDVSKVKPLLDLSIQPLWSWNIQWLAGS
ncbi:uncharacterized protein LOC120545769 [Perca fluviatilis]|uniref:uncharacterized protein LOC120545769 n=1 Tax=Perca fluviatilis TaxID=8168 RepID=UPI001963C6C0|nr:uncharacterized protein LOC120545769 [Perca fluviatilis]